MLQESSKRIFNTCMFNTFNVLDTFDTFNTFKTYARYVYVQYVVYQTQAASDSKHSYSTTRMQPTDAVQLCNMTLGALASCQQICAGAACSNTSAGR